MGTTRRGEWYGKDGWGNTTARQHPQRTNDSSPSPPLSLPDTSSSTMASAFTTVTTDSTKHRALNAASFSNVNTMGLGSATPVVSMTR